MTESLTVPGNETITGSSQDGESTPRTLERGASLGRYIVLERIGAGGMGVVYAAYDPSLDRKVALKLLRPRADPSREAAAQARLLREAQAMAQLSHPQVIPVHDVGTHQDQVFLAMEFVDGETLGDYFARSPPWRDVVRMFVQAARGIAAAHAVGLIHRDFKPDNVLIGRDGRARVMDFGLARPATEEEPRPRLTDTVEQPDKPALRTPLTQTGAMVGTPAYMAPEQHLGDAVDERSDQFAACIVLYEGLYGQRPFAGETIAAVAFAVCQGNLRPPPPGVRVPSRIWKIVARGLQSDPNARWGNVSELIEALERALAPRKAWLGIGVAALGATLGGAWLTNARQTDDPRARCAALDLGPSWDETRRAQLRRTFGEKQADWASESLTLVEGQIDQFAHAWSEMATQSCYATQVTHTQSDRLGDLRTQCLERRKDEFDTVIEYIATDQPGAVQAAPRLVSLLVPVEVCADQDRLEAAVPLPDDPRLAQRIRTLRSELTAVKTAADARQVGALGDRAEKTLQGAKETGYLPLIAEAHFALGRVLRERGDKAGAEAANYEAVSLAAQSKHHELEAKAWISLVFGLGYRTDRFEESRIAMIAAEAALARAGRPPSLEARLLSNQGAVYWWQRDFERAREFHLASGKIRDREFGPSSPQATSHLSGLANVETRLENYEVALEYQNRVLKILETTHGTAHPIIASILGNRSGTFRQLEDLDRAIADGKRAVDLLVAANGEEHPPLGVPLYNYADALSEAGRHEEALATFRWAHRLWREANGGDHADTTAAARRVGSELRALGRDEDAMEAWLASRKDQAPLPARNYRNLALALLIAELLIDQGKFAQAKEELDWATLDDEQARERARYYARGRFLLAQAHAGAGGSASKKKVIALARSARAFDDDPKLHNEIDAWLAARDGLRP